MYEQVDEAKDAVVDNKQPDPSKMSVSAVESVKRGIICGVVQSLANYLFNHTSDQHEAAKKMLMFTNAIRANKDLPDNDTDWIFDTYFGSLKSQVFATDPECSVPCCSSAYLSWYTAIANVIDNTNVYAWSFSDKAKETLTEQEVAIVESLKTAQDVYWKARNTFENYFREVNKQVLKDVLLRYGTTLAQIAPKWYDDVTLACGLRNRQEHPEKV